jgi:hypothetical protein
VTAFSGSTCVSIYRLSMKASGYPEHRSAIRRFNPPRVYHWRLPRASVGSPADVDPKPTTGCGVVRVRFGSIAGVRPPKRRRPVVAAGALLVTSKRSSRAGSLARCAAGRQSAAMVK